MTVKTVYKYTLTPGPGLLELPPNSQAVHVAGQNEQPTLWVEQDIHSPDTERWEIGVYGTGHPIPTEAIHLGTAMCAGGALVWHVYRLL